MGEERQIDDEAQPDQQGEAPQAGEHLLECLLSTPLPLDGDEAHLMESIAGDFATAAQVAKDLAARPDVDDTLIDWVDEMIDVLSDRATRVRQIMARRHVSELRKVEWNAVIARSVKGLREMAGWTQDEIASGMRAIGFKRWKRITVAEAESGKRKMQLEELAGYAILFGTTVGDILTDLHVSEEALVINDHIVLSDTEAAGLVSRDREAGIGADPRSQLQGRLAGINDPGSPDDWRPIANDRHERFAEAKGALIDREQDKASERWEAAGYPD